MRNRVTSTHYKGSLTGTEFTQLHSRRIVPFERTVVHVLYTELQCTDPIEIRRVGYRSLAHISGKKPIAGRAPSREAVTHQSRIGKKEVHVAISKRNIHASESREARIAGNIKKCVRRTATRLGMRSK